MMKTLIAAVCALVVCAAQAHAAEQNVCRAQTTTRQFSPIRTSAETTWTFDRFPSRRAKDINYCPIPPKETAIPMS